MAKRFESDEESVWRVGEVRTVTIRDEDRGFVYTADYTVTEDLTIFGPVNERWESITTNPTRHPTR